MKMFFDWDKNSFRTRLPSECRDLITQCLGIISQKNTVLSYTTAKALKLIKMSFFTYVFH